MMDEAKRPIPLSRIADHIRSQLDLDDPVLAIGRTLGEIAADGTREVRATVQGIMHDLSGQRQAIEAINRSAEASPLERLLAAHQTAFNEDPGQIDEIQQLAVLYKAVELAKQAAPDSTLNFDLAIGFVAGAVAGYAGAGRAKALSKSL